MCGLVKNLFLTVYILYINNGVYCQSGVKSSLAFVIDSTGSMEDDIEAVKRQADSIFDTVAKSNTSQVEDFVLVEFNDPYVNDALKTKDKEQFKRKLDSIKVDGGGDCPEMALTGIQKALEVSRPGSDVYVFTDAYAKDEDKYETVKQLATDKGCRIDFIISDDFCTLEKPYSPVYHNLAKDRDGQVFSLDKSNVELLLNYVKENIKSKKTLIAKYEFSSGRHIFNYTIDPYLKEIIVSVTGDNLKLNISDPYGNIAEVEDLVKMSKISILKIIGVKPGVYTSEVESDNKGTMNVYGTSTLHFEHGFSRLQPIAFEETTVKPYPDEKSYLAVKVNVHRHDLLLTNIELYDLSGNLIEHQFLNVDNSNDQFYITTQDFVPPNKSFWIAIKGVDSKTNSIITRFGLIPIKPQKRNKDLIEEKAPNITIIGAAKVHVQYEDPVLLKCRISGYPKPKITWEDKTGKKIRNAVIKYNQEGQFVCRFDSAPKRATIIWKRGKKQISNDDYYKISSDGTVLTIKHMKPKLQGNYSCLAFTDQYSKVNKFVVDISGIVKPKIDKRNTEIRAARGSRVTIGCKIIEGIPKPKINWYFISSASTKKVSIKGAEKIYLDNVTLTEAGSYTCKAINDGGIDSLVIKLIVEYPPYIENSVKNVIKIENEKVILPCIAFGAPEPHVIWHFNEKLANDKRFLHYKDYSLGFIAQRDLSGQYRCIAENKLGVVKSNKISVFVIVPVTIEKPYDSTKEMAVGQDLNLKCIAHGDPTPKVQWVFNSFDFTVSLNLFYTDSNEPLRLKILQVKQEGYYTCTATNFRSSDNFTYTVYILAPPEIISEKSSNVFEAVVGDTVLKVPCRTRGSPAPIITWVKDGFNIASGTDWYDIEKDGTLLIKYVNKAMRGFYTCKAENRMGSVTKTYEVIVTDFPKPGMVYKTVTIGIGEQRLVTCPIKHAGVDYVRWYKGSELIRTRTLNFINFSLIHAGLYTCRVSNFEKSYDKSVLLKVDPKPKFVSNPETTISFAEGIYTELDCSFYSEQEAKVSWWHNRKKLKETDMFYKFKMTWHNKGQYECLVNNKFGSIFRKFNVATEDCVLDVDKHFGPKRPIIVTKFDWTNSRTIIDGHMRIPHNYTIVLACPSKFVLINAREITAVCMYKTKFQIEGHDYDYVNLKCTEEFNSEIHIADKQCLSKDHKLVEIGHTVDNMFREEFKVCYDFKLMRPSFAKYEIYPALAGTTVEEETWYDIEDIPLNFDELYDCNYQYRWLYSLLGHPVDNECCFSRRQLVNVRDMLPGLPQLATFSSLNYFSFWSTCNSKNWDLVEDRIRSFVKKLNYPLAIWAGTSGVLKLPGKKKNNVHIYLNVTSGRKVAKVPKYIWKVIQDPIKKASLAIIQTNIPNLNQDKARKNKCSDICRDVPWMQDSSWREVKYGLIYCCKIEDFEKKFKLDNVFDPDMNKVLL